MGRLLVMLLLGTSLIILSSVVFGSGTISRFYQVASVITNFQHGEQLISGDAAPETDVMLVIKFIVEVFCYYFAAAILTFGFDLFLPNAKKKEK